MGRARSQGHDCQRGVNRGGSRENTAVADIQARDVMTGTPAVHNTFVGIITHTAGTQRMSATVGDVKEFPVISTACPTDFSRGINCIAEQVQFVFGSAVHNPWPRKAILVGEFRIRGDHVRNMGLVLADHGQADHPGCNHGGNRPPERHHKNPAR